MMDSRLGTCEVCSNLPAKYTCPGCELNTCSLSCVKEHKETYDCDGKRNKTAYKPLSKLTDLDFKSDYGLLEEIANSVDSYNRDPLKKTGHIPGNIPKLTENKVPETEMLGESLLKKLGQCDESWAFKIASDGLDNVCILLQAENIKDAKSRFFELESEKTIEQNLKGHTLVEFPIFKVVPKESLEKYQLITLEQAKKEMADTMEKEKQSREQTKERFANGMDSVEEEVVMSHEADDEELCRKRARLDIPEVKSIGKISDEEMEIGDNFFNL